MAPRFLQKVAFIAVVTTFVCSAALAGQARLINVSSPDGKNALMVECSGGSITWTVTRAGRKIVDPSAVKITLAGKGELTKGVQLLDVKEDRIDETFDLSWGKCRTVRTVWG